MTYRERRLAKAERLALWAENREAKADAAAQRSSELADMIPFGQPILVGHHSEKRHRRHIDKIDSAMRESVDSSRKAESMASRAEEIERQAANAIYSDDPDAIERLEEKIVALEAKRDARKAANTAFRKVNREALKAMTPYQRNQAVPFPSYSITNVTGVIGTTKKRLEQLKREKINGPIDRIITARFDSECADCGATLSKGSSIRYNKQQSARCMECES